MENTQIKVLCFHPIFLENAQIFCKRTGFEYCQDIQKDENTKMYIIFGLHHSNHIMSMLNILSQKEELKLFVFQTEQMNSRIFENKYYIQLLQHKHVYVMDWSYSNKNVLKRQFNIEVNDIFLFDFFKADITDEWKDRPIDICFIGCKSETRVRTIENLKARFPNLKYFIHYDNKLTDPNKIKQVLSKCKFLLNIPYYNNSALETHRICNGLSAGCKVITYHSHDDELDEIYKPYVYFTSQLHKIIQKHLDNELHEKHDYDHFYENVFDCHFKSNLKNILRHFMNE